MAKVDELENTVDGLIEVVANMLHIEDIDGFKKGLRGEEVDSKRIHNILPRSRKN